MNLSVKYISWLSDQLLDFQEEFYRINLVSQQVFTSEILSSVLWNIFFKKKKKIPLILKIHASLIYN
jgi:hypothetical protein